MAAMPDSAGNVDGPPEASLETYAHAIADAFPALTPLEPLALLGRDWSSAAVRTPGDIVFRFPANEAAGESLRKEARLLPYLRGHLAVAIPVPEWRVDATVAQPWGFSGARDIPGRPLLPGSIRERNTDRLAHELAQFLAELHRFPLERAAALEVQGPRAWREPYVRLRAAVLPVLRRRLGVSEYGRLRRWWVRFLADTRQWTFPPCLVHTGLRAENILIDAEAVSVVGIVDWENVATGDPAIDIAGITRAYGGEFSWRVLEEYRALGMDVDAEFLLRARRLGAAATFFAVQASVEREGAEGVPTLDDAVAAVRSGAMLAE